MSKTYVALQSGGAPGLGWSQVRPHAILIYKKVAYVDARQNHGARYLGFLTFDALEVKYTTYKMYNHKNLKSVEYEES